LCDALTILSAYCRAGRPSQGLKPKGSFEGWSDLVRNAIVWVDQADPEIAAECLYETNDSGADERRTIFAGLQAMDPEGDGLTAREIVSKAVHAFPGCEAPPALTDFVEFLCSTTKDCRMPDARKVGKLLRKHLGTIVGGRKLRASENSDKTKVWLVK